ncbi:hypothetical protein HDV62DRAFT_356723 [Trichoderma sp. SZMC 28011]
MLLILRTPCHSYAVDSNWLFGWTILVGNTDRRDPQVSASHMPVKASQTLTSRCPSKYGSMHPEAGRGFTRQWWIVEPL